ncbi:LysR family transcriptional regulator [Variovorax ginsengisoli]|uniref:LysR substrate-binding domain-containing protein n=1 Tax=Variovorax ginsengisoli TaxID=363844 RepID=A0ABT8S7D4_9BURK|nr:LysR substrate-binding domain-containing protein [Variovorax ginsengisoli]MDN8615666.1 LysR substrate-binding domain-containing protein [Variovorax ginsengisoli]MDO1534836.1 LysR substrate-binding domain-containing protein [Variovorax ginsengisoli]
MNAQDLELDLLRALVAVAEAGSFTGAASLVNRSQSAVSQKVLRLEEILQLRVFDRTSRSMTLTKDGERVLAAGRRMLDYHDALMRELREPAPITTLRLGVSENLVQAQLPQLLSRFSHLYPSVHLELTTGLSADLVANHEAGQLDVVIAKPKNEGSSRRGRVIWREALVWIAASTFRSRAGQPVQLVMMRPPCVYREVMTQALDASKREWNTACTSSNLNGTLAAVRAGLGVTVLGKSFVQSGMKILPTSQQWPALPNTEVAVISEDSALQHIVQPLVALLSEVLLSSDVVEKQSQSDTA